MTITGWPNRIGTATDAAHPLQFAYAGSRVKTASTPADESYSDDTVAATSPSLASYFDHYLGNMITQVAKAGTGSFQIGKESQRDAWDEALASGSLGDFADWMEEHFNRSLSLMVGTRASVIGRYQLNLLIDEFALATAQDEVELGEIEYMQTENIGSLIEVANKRSYLMRRRMPHLASWNRC